MSRRSRDCGIPIPAPATAETLDRAIGHIVELQRSDGSFGVWSDTDDTVPWLDAYATDFLIRAKEHGKNVPDFAIKSAVGWLHDYVRQEHTEIEDLPALAYAHYVLARAKSDDLDGLRYFYDTQMARLPTQLAKAQIAAALAQYGDTHAPPPPMTPLSYRAAAASRDPLCRLRQRVARQRRGAVVCRRRSRQPAAADGGHRPHRRALRRAARTSTQEQAWLLMAAEAAAKAGGGVMTVASDGGAPQTRSEPLYLRRPLGSGHAADDGHQPRRTPAWRSVSITGVRRPICRPRTGAIAVSREIFRPDGTAADLGKARQTDLFVVVIKGTRTDASQSAQTLVVDLLPAGFEIETATVSKGRATTDYSWLPELTEATYTEQRDDRFIAALDLKSGAKDFTLAYVVRAVTPGEFKYPALVAEDMYEPEITGRTAIGKLTVGAR